MKSSSFISIGSQKRAYEVKYMYSHDNYFAIDNLLMNPGQSLLNMWTVALSQISMMGPQSVILIQTFTNIILDKK